MTKKTFWDEPYQHTHDTTVTSVVGDDVTLDSTIFFAMSGGQESDHGTIGDSRVVAARKEGLEIIYTLASDHGLTVGQHVRIEIDWARRNRLMRLHFAAELVLELLVRELACVDKVGAHIAPHKARVDFAWSCNIAPLLPRISTAANSIIASDLEIRTGFDDRVAERRFWEVQGFARVPCGGTHVRRTSEVGAIRLRRENIGRGKERVEIFLEDVGERGFHTATSRAQT